MIFSAIMTVVFWRQQRAAYGQPEDHSKAIEAGFDGHLVKPVDPEQLAALLSALPHR